MKGFPQLRVRTGFSFRQAFGTIDRVAGALGEMGCPAAGIVDGSTWGHVRWSRAAGKAGFKPLFGFEAAFPQPDGRRPVSWVLGAASRPLYRLSTAARAAAADLPALWRAAGDARDIFRFAGAALENPELFDYIDLNPASPLQVARALALHKKTGKPLVITSDNSYPRREDRPVFLAMGGRERSSPQHLMDVDELRAALPALSASMFDKALRNTVEVAEKCTGALDVAPPLSVKGNFRKTVEEGRKQRLKLGHLASWPREYADRLKHEMSTIEANGYQSYFLVVADLVNWAKKRMLVGPGRGSSAGSLTCYVTRITEVDPIPHHLIFERFISAERKDLPDIDIDFNDTKREQVFQYLRDKYGEANVARIGNISSLQARSALAEVCKRFQIPDNDRFNLVNVMIEYSSGDARWGKGIEDTLQMTEIGKQFLVKYPQAKVMTELEHHPWHTSVHAAGVLVSNDPISDFCTVGPDGVAHIDKPDAEALNLLKIDALGLRTLGIIEDSGVVTPDELYALTLDDPKAFDVFNKRHYAAVFQFEGNAQRQVASQVHVSSFREIDHITALARPGPLGGGATDHYIKRHAGLEPVVPKSKRTAEILADTFGVVLYQEQVMRISRDIGKFSWADISTIRKAMSASKGEEFFNRHGEAFIKGAATEGINEREARDIWSEIVTFGAWGMNRAHTVSYAVISYWCAWMKAYYPLEYAAACLRNTKDDQSAVAILREMQEEGISYVPFDIDRSALNWSVDNGQLLGGWLNLAGIGPAKATAAIEARAKGTLDREKYLALEVKFANLYPLKTKYADLYAHPEKYGCREGSRVLMAHEFPEAGDVLFLGTIMSKQPRDENETRRIAKRNGRIIKPPSLFVDLQVKDDVNAQILCRVGRFDYDPLGIKVVNNLNAGDEVLIRGRRIRNFSMINIDRIRCLNRPEALD